MDFDHRHSAGYLINHLSRLFFEELRNRIEPLGIVPGQFPALLALWQKDGQTQRALVDALDVEQATMANTLNRMERDGLIVRKDHPHDRRAKVICLTDKAKAIRDEAYASATSVNDMALQDLSSVEQAQFIDFMKRILATLQRS